MGASVEDEPDIGLAVQSSLAADGNAVDLAADGRDALDGAAAYPTTCSSSTPSRRARVGCRGQDLVRLGIGPGAGQVAGQQAANAPQPTRRAASGAG